MLNLLDWSNLLQLANLFFVDDGLFVQLVCSWFLCLNWLFWYITRLFVTDSALFRVNVEKKLYFNFLRWGALLWKFALIGKLCYLKNCVTLKDCITWRLCYFEWLRHLKIVILENCVTLKSCDIWKVAILWKTDFLLNNYVIWKTALGCVTCKMLRWGALL